MEDKDFSNNNQVSSHQQGFEVINYKLTSIENTLSDLKSLLIQVPIMEKDLADLKKDLTELEFETKEQNCKNAEEFRKINDKINTIENEPVKKDASRWRYIVDYIFKAGVAAACVYLFAKG